jgi:hypothetical protein
VAEDDEKKESQEKEPDEKEGFRKEEFERGIDTIQKPVRIDKGNLDEKETHQCLFDLCPSLQAQPLVEEIERLGAEGLKEIKVPKHDDKFFDLRLRDLETNKFLLHFGLNLLYLSSAIEKREDEILQFLHSIISQGERVLGRIEGLPSIGLLFYLNVFPHAEGEDILKFCLLLFWVHGH